MLVSLVLIPIGHYNAAAQRHHDHHHHHQTPSQQVVASADINPSAPSYYGVDVADDVEPAGGARGPLLDAKTYSAAANNETVIREYALVAGKLQQTSSDEDNSGNFDAPHWSQTRAFK
jgi:hypothetical protein